MTSALWLYPCVKFRASVRFWWNIHHVDRGGKPSSSNVRALVALLGRLQASMVRNLTGPTEPLGADDLVTVSAWLVLWALSLSPKWAALGPLGFFDDPECAHERTRWV